MPMLPGVSFNACVEILKKTMTVPPFVLQIGAMDGVRFDLLHAHLIKGGWRGLLVEPLPDMIEKLRQTYAAHTELVTENCAIANHDGIMTLYRADPAAIEAGILPETSLGMTSAFKDRGLPQDYTQPIEVPCFPLQRVLDRHNVTAINLVVIDTEGAD